MEDSGITAVNSVDLKERLVALILPIVEHHEAVLVDLELKGAFNSQVIRLLVHKAPAATVQLCEAISREMADLLDAEDPIPGRYRLEVTSPGLDRPLDSDGDFKRAEARNVKVTLSAGNTFLGRLVAWDADSITLDCENEERSIGRPDIAKATIEAEL